MASEEVRKKVNELQDKIADLQKKSHTVISLHVVKKWLREIQEVNK